MIEVTYDQDSLDRFIDWMEKQKREAVFIVTNETDQARVDSAIVAMNELNQAMWFVHAFLDDQEGYGAQPHAERLPGYPAGQPN